MRRPEPTPGRPPEESGEAADDRIAGSAGEPGEGPRSGRPGGSGNGPPGEPGGDASVPARGQPPSRLAIALMTLAPFLLLLLLWSLDRLIR